MNKGSNGHVTELRINKEGPRFSAVITLENSEFTGTEDFSHLTIRPPVDFEDCRIDRDDQGKPRSIELLSSRQLPLARNEAIWVYIDQPR
ncbi:MAG: hypothetical protein JO015_16895 [Verrucomicrobia bacterium]|nr:hypothetical protein [Verrucomicrobiota bacterium]